MPAIYEAIQNGSASGADYLHVARPLQGMARERSQGTSAEKLGAIKVASSLGTIQAVAILVDLCTDPDVEVRRECLYRSLGLGLEGLAALRKMVGDPDDALCVSVLDHLIRAADQASATGARRLLRDPRPPVRAKAAELLGLVGGLGVQIDLKRLHEDEGEEKDVREAADLAVQQIRGEATKPDPTPWWQPAQLPEPAPERPRGKVIESLSLNAARRMIRDPEPENRLAAATAIGELGGVSTILQLGELCSDADPDVKAAARAAMQTLCERVERPDLGARYLT